MPRRLRRGLFYFLRRGQLALPVDEGYELLQTAAKAEPIGTNKWFRLQNLCAFAAFRVPGAATSQGFEAYEAIFDHAADAATANAGYPLRQSILEFVDSVPGRFRDFGLSKDTRTKELLLKAWTAYAVALSAPLNGAKIAEPNWNAALKKSQSLEAFVPAVEKVLADPKVPKTFGLLLTVAAVLAPQKPGKAMELLEAAKPLIPKDAAKADINEAARVYLPLVDLLASNERLPDAIKNQREFVVLTGRGQARLILLLRQSGDEAATTQLLAELVDAKTDEHEVALAASGLFKLARDAKTPDPKAGEQAETLLVNYLAAPRPRDLVSELEARLSLGNAYLRGHRYEEATKILTFEAPTTTDPDAKKALRDIERMKAQVQGAMERVATP